MNASKSLALAFCVGFLVAAPVTSCGPTSGACDADSCAHGCCDSAGKCQNATSVFQCGNNGQACQVCGATQQCIIGICTGGIGGGGSGSTGGGFGTTGGGVGTTGGGIATTGGGNGTTGGGNGTTGGGNGTTGGGNGTTGGGNGTTGGGVGSTGGGVGNTGGGTAVNCNAATALSISGGQFSASGSTSGAQNDIHFACSTTDFGEDVLYSFTLASPSLVTVYASFETTTGGIAIVQLGQCTSRSGSDCIDPSQTSPFLQSSLPAGTWGVVVKTASANSGPYSLGGSIEPSSTGGGSGSTGGGVGSTGGGSATGGGSGSTGGGSATGGGSGSTGGGSATGGGSGTGTALVNGSGMSVSGGLQTQTVYYIDVPSGMTELDITVTPSSGDPDLYERWNSAPDLANSGYDHAGETSGDDVINISAPTAGRHYITVYGYSAYIATLTAEYY